MKLFVSYSRCDRSEIQPLIEFLEQSSHELWFDFRLLPGQDWKRILADQIQAADVLLYAMSQYSLASEWCRWELGQALEHNKPIMPVMLHQVIIPEELSHMHAVSITEMNRILGGLANLSARGLGKGSPSLSIPASPKGVPSRAAWKANNRSPTPHQHINTTSLIGRRHSMSDPRPADLNYGKGILGIDFGTTHSLCSIWEGDSPKLIPNHYGSFSTPSAVYVQNDHSVIVGDAAVNSILRDPQHGVLQVKRLFGLDAKLEAYGRTWTASELAAEIFKALAADAATFLGKPSRDIIVTAPAYFNEAQFDDLRLACELANLKVRRIIAEPTAASLAYGYREMEDKEVAVVDLGGGTFDISILNISDGVLEVLAIDGESELGGTDYDETLVDYCLACFHEQTGIDLADNLGARMRIRDAAEKAKIELTTTDASSVFVPFIFSDASGAMDLEVRITRDQFNGLTEHLTARILECCERAMNSCWDEFEIKQVLLVGLPTRTPMIIERLTHYFGIDPSPSINPETCVAEGAAIQGSIMQGEIRDLLLLDATAHSLGLAINEGASCTIIGVATTIPIMRSRNFLLTSPEQTHVELRVVQGESEKADENLLLASIVLELGGELPKKPEVTVTFAIEANGQLNVTAALKNTKQRRKENVNQPIFESLPESAIGGTLQLEEPKTTKMEQENR